MARHYNLARVATATTGTGTITLGSPLNGFLSFSSAGVANGDVISYAISDGVNSEVGRGTYSSSGPTLTRGAIASTNSNNAINLSGSAIVFITPLAADFDAAGVPQGRLTLTANTPVMTGNATGQTTVRYTPYKGNLLPLYDGARWTWHEFSELTQATTDTTKSPSAVTTNSTYDVFAWIDSGTIRATRGPAWSSATARGTGAGTTELVRVNGKWLNAVAITNGPAAQRGTYLGSIRSNGSSQIDWRYGALAAGGTSGLLGVYNAYNRVRIASTSSDSTDSWTYASTTWRRSNNSAGMACFVLQGLQEDAIEAEFSCILSGTSTTVSLIGIGVASTTALSGACGYCPLTGVSNVFGQGVAKWSGSALGWTEIAAIETCSSANSVTFYGDVGDATRYSNGLLVRMWG